MRVEVGAVARQKRAVVIEESPVLSNVLQTAGWHAVRFSPQHVNTGTTASLSLEIKHMKYDLIWVDLPLVGRHIRKEKYFSALTQICTWAQLAAEAGVMIGIFGAYGAAWNHASFASLSANHRFLKSYHRACHFGLKLDPQLDNPSKICFVFLSSPSCNSHQCKCNVPQDQHVLDWKPSSTYVARRPRSQLQSEIGAKVLEEWIDLPACPSTQSALHSSPHDTPDDSVHRVSDRPDAEVCQPRSEPSQHNMSTCYPTLERERQKERAKKLKAEGKKAKTRPVHVEEHHDDCGHDLSGIVPMLKEDISKPNAADTSLHEAIGLVAGLETYWLLGSEVSNNLLPQNKHTYIAGNMQEAAAVLAGLDSQADIVELCGGTSGTATVCIRKHLRTGANFDLVTQCDLNTQQEHVIDYFDKHKPLVAVLSPSCPDAIHRSSLYATFFGQLALKQNHENRYFILEQPEGSCLYEAYPWTFVCHLPSACFVTIHRCMLSRRGRGGLPQKVQIDFMANHQLLLEGLMPFQCDVSHQHDTAVKSKCCQPWPWVVANRIAVGIAKLKQHVQEVANVHVFPVRSIGTGPCDKREVDVEELWRKCAGCRGRQSKYDPRHSRIVGECLWPDIAPLDWSCPGCKKHKPYGHESHTLSADCKHAVISHRTGVQRSGKHPRGPRIPATASDTTDLQPQLADGTDLAAEEEAKFKADSQYQAVDPPPEIVRLSKCQNWVTACNGDPVFVFSPCAEFVVPCEEFASHKFRTTWIYFNDKWYLLEFAVSWQETEYPEGVLPCIADTSVTIFHNDPSVDRSLFAPNASANAEHRNSATRHRRTFQDAAVGQEKPADWTRFDISRSLRALAAGSPAVQRKELRKLHLRWWHASKESMRRVLSAAGLSAQVLNEIANIVDTCRECRMWSRPANETIPTLRMSTKFNEHVECDLLFYREFVIFHLICCCTRWHSAIRVVSKNESELFDALHKSWLTAHGPMQQLICDGELGLMSPSAQSRLRRLGIEPKLRAPGQHARFIERRGALLRLSMHCIEAQLTREGVDSSIDAVLSEAVFAGNALIHVGGVTPYQCVYGRSPAMLPPLPEENMTDASEELGSLAERSRQHIRTAALEAMIQATSLARTSRALRSKTVAATQISYNPGDLVDYHRPSPKDISGWHGPAEVLDVKPQEGTIVIRINGRPKPCRLQDVRHTLYAHVSFQIFVVFSTKEALQILFSTVQSLPVRQFITLGFISGSDGSTHLAPDTKKYTQLVRAVDYLVEHVWNFDECHAVRLGRGCQSLPPAAHVTHSTLLYWNENHQSEPSVYITDTAKVLLKELVGSQLEETLFIQLLHNSVSPSGLCDCIDATDATHGEPTGDQLVLRDHQADRLSTIPEGTHESEHEPSTAQSNPEFSAFLQDHFPHADCTDRPELFDLWNLYQDAVEYKVEEKMMTSH